MAHFAKPWYRKGRGWFLEVNGKQVKLADDRKEAFERYHQIMSGQSPSGTQVSEIIDSFLEWCQRHRAKGTYGWHKYRCDLFWTHLKSKNLRYLTVDEFKPFHLEEWIAAHPTWNPGMVRGALQSVQRAFSWAVKQGRIAKSPIVGIEKPPSGRRDNIITPEMFSTIIGLVKGQCFNDLITVAWEVGCRPSEIRKVEARHYQQGRWVFPKEESKGKKKARIVLLTPKAEEITKRLCEKYPSGPIFRSRRGNPWNISSVNCRFCRLQKKIKRKFALADFRHSFVTRLLKNRVDPVTIGFLCGHADLSMVARVYAHVNEDDEHLRKALNSGA